MQHYSLLSLIRNGLTRQQHWHPAWHDATPQSAYDVVIIGGGGHGLATAYYLAKVHGITKVAVVEKGWIGGGNSGRNTSVVRSNYLFPQSAAFYDFSLRLYEGLSRELNYNIMLRQKGMVQLIQSRHDLELAQRSVNAMHLNGVDADLIDAAHVKALLPLINMAPNARHPILGGVIQRRGGIVRHDAVVWGYARAADRLGVDIIQNCAVTGFDIHTGRIRGVQTARGAIKTQKVAICVAGHSSVLASMAGFRLPVTSMALQAMVTEPVKPAFDVTVLSPATGVYVSQSDKGEMIIGGGLDGYPSYAQRGNVNITEDILSGVLDLFPSFSRLKLMRQWAGIVDIVHDSSPILGLTPVHGLYINCGFGTGGFKAIPAGGWTLAHTIAHDRPHPLIEPFSLARFETGAFIDEMGAAGIRH